MKLTMQIFALLTTLLISYNSFAADNFNAGAKECQECHEHEYDVWKKTPHFKSYKKLHKSKEAKKILKALGERSMKRSDKCVLCHYTKIKKKASKKAKVKSGPSCESCHGASSKWRKIHNDYGGPKLKAADESAAHKSKRLADAEAGGMISSHMVYRISSNCMQCHGLANTKLDKDTLTTMLDNEHPIEPDFEVLAYSQGKLRHRFIPPNVDVNAKLDDAGAARLFLGGQAASLVTASAAANKSNNADYQSSIQQRISTAKNILKAVGIAEAKTLIKSPTHKNALAFETAIRNENLYSAVKGFMPKKSDYK